MSPRKKTRAIRQERQVRTGSKGGNPSRRGSSAFKKRARQVQTDMIEDPSLPFKRAARKRRIDPRTVLNHLPSGFRKDSSGRIIARALPKRQKLLYIPWFEPGEVKPIPTKSEADRLLVGRWMTALNAAGHDRWSKMDRFPRGTRIGGVLLPTKRAEVQQILVSLADRESPFEGLYRTTVRRR